MGAAPHRAPAEPWASFLRELDELLKGSVELHCLGGFVVTQQYGIGRETADIDFLSIVRSREDDVEALAGLGSDALSKLERNADRDRDDVLRLARAGLVDAQALKARYFEEVRPYFLSREGWHDQTLDLWLEMISPTNSQP